MNDHQDKKSNEKSLPFDGKNNSLQLDLNLSDFNASGNSDAIRKIAEIEHRIQKEKEKQGQAKFLGLAISPKDFVKLLIIIFVVSAWMRVYFDQTDIKNKSVESNHQNLAGGGDLEGQIIETVQVTTTSEVPSKVVQNQKPTINTESQRGYETKTLPSKMKRQSLAAKMVSRSNVRQTALAGAVDNDWSSIFTCAANAVWRDFGGKNFLRVSDQMLIFSSNKKTYFYTPFFAGSQQIFTGPFLQRPIVKLSRLFHFDPGSWIPHVFLVLPLRFELSSLNIKAHTYVKVRRDGEITRIGPTTLGDPWTVIDEMNLVHTLNQEPLLWDYVSGRIVVDKDAQKQLRKNMERQIRRYRYAKKRDPQLQSKLFTNSMLSDYDSEFRVHRACEKAGTLMGSSTIVQEATHYLSSLKKNGLYGLSRPSVNISNVRSDTFPENFIKAHALMNSVDFETCARSYLFGKALQQSIALELNSNGSVKEMIPFISSMEAPKFNQCLSSKISSWRFPSVQEIEKEKLFFDLTIRASTRLQASH